jgi:Mg2+ and Co2+ transporter CorA
MIRVQVLRDGRHMEHADVADLAALRGDPGTLIRVEVASPTPEDLAALGREFGIHEVALEDLEIGERQRPKVEQYPDQDQVLLVWYGARPGTAERPTLLWEVDLVAGQNYLITSHGGGPIDPTPFARRVKARRELASEGAGYLQRPDPTLPPGRLRPPDPAHRDRRGLPGGAGRHPGRQRHHMPELAWRYGYAWALGLMMVTATALWIYFKRKGWL